MEPKTDRRIRVSSASESFWLSVKIVFPHRTRLPAVALSRQPRMLTRVVFPDPEGPTNETNSPRRIFSEISSKAGISSPPRLYILVIPVASSAHSWPSMSFSFAADGLERPDPGGAPGRIETAHDSDPQDHGYGQKPQAPADHNQAPGRSVGEEAPDQSFGDLGEGEGEADPKAPAQQAEDDRFHPDELEDVPGHGADTLDDADLLKPLEDRHQDRVDHTQHGDEDGDQGDGEDHHLGR